MKRLLFALVAFVLLSRILMAAPTVQINVNLAWDAMPAGEQWTTVRIYEVTGTSAVPMYTKVAETTSGAVATVSFLGTPGVHKYVARAWTGLVESPDSNVVTVGIPLAPANLKVTVTITITSGG